MQKCECKNVSDGTCQAENGKPEDVICADRSKDKGQEMGREVTEIEFLEAIGNYLQQPPVYPYSLAERSDSAKCLIELCLKKLRRSVAAPETPQPQGRQNFEQFWEKFQHSFYGTKCGREASNAIWRHAISAVKLDALAATPTGQGEQRQLQIKVHLEEIKRNTAVYESLRGKECFIFAGDGGCYWKANAFGYTDLANAAAYKFEEAYSLTHHCGTEKRIEFHFFDRVAPSVPIREADEYKRGFGDGVAHTEARLKWDEASKNFYSTRNLRVEIENLFPIDWDKFTDVQRDLDFATLHWAEGVMRSKIQILLSPPQAAPQTEK